MRPIARGRAINTPIKFPLRLTSTRITDARGTPVYLHGDTPWSIVPQLSTAQMATYLDNRASKGVNAILFNMIEHNFTDQSPAYRTAEGYDPFTTMTDFASPGTNYWAKVDYLVNEAKSRGIVCVANPAYWGYQGGSEGWWTEINAESAADLQTYGAWLANRFTQGNVIWCLGGDWAGTNSATRDKQWNIVTGIRSVRTSDLITAHNDRSDSDAYSTWNGYAGFNLNAAYTDANIVGESATALGRTGYPFFHIEAYYRNENSATTTTVRVQAWQSLCMGANGHFYGERPSWACGSTTISGSGAATWISSGLNEAGIVSLQHLRSFTREFPHWHTWTAKRDTSLISSSLGSGAASVCPMLSADAKFAAIHVNTGASVTLVLSAFTGLSSVRVRWFDPSAGTWSNVGTYSPSGTQVVTYPGANAASASDWVLVCDGAP